MTKAEIEKAIENGESVWGLCGGVYEIKLSEHSEQFFDRDNNYCYTDKNGEKHCCFLQLLYKTKAEAEHYLLHANVTRTETLPFLTWEEFQKTGYLDFIGADKNHYCIDKSSEGIVLGKFVNNSKALYEWVKHWKGFNENNFYKAYDEAVRLFKGKESKDKWQLGKMQELEGEDE